jgi:dephospho-CoA kinase
MLRVALTGGIGTGKSHVRTCFEELGVATIDADRLVHEALRSGTPTTTRIAERFGEEVLAADGAVDRRALGDLVFADPVARRDLEGLIHPAVYAAIDAWFEECRRSGVDLAMADIPLLYETGHERAFDAVVVTACTPDEQVRRVEARDGLSAEAAGQRVAAQLPIGEKVAKSDFVIWTTGTVDDTATRVDEVYEALRQRALTR